MRLHKIVVRLLGVLLLFVPLESSLFGQTVVFQRWYTRNLGNGTGGTETFRVYNTGTLYYRLHCSPTGTVSAADVKLEQSLDGSSWSDLITTKDCTSAVNATSTSTQTNYVRVNVESFTGSGSIYIGFIGFLTPPSSASATVAIDQSTPGTTNAVACVSGCAGGTTADDDGTVPGGTTTGSAVGFNYMWSGSNWIRTLGSSIDGLLVNLGGNNDVIVNSGTVTANLGTLGGAATAANQSTANTSLGNIDTYTSRLLTSASAAAGGAGSATTALIVGGMYNSTPITLTNGQQAAFQFDANGFLKISGAVTGGNDAASATGSAVPAKADYTGVNVGGTLRGQTGAARGSEFAATVQIVDASGNQVTTFGGAGGTASNYGSAVPSAGTAAGFSDGTNMQLSRVFDIDSGGGTQYVLGAVIRNSGSGGSTEVTFPAALSSDGGFKVSPATADAAAGATVTGTPVPIGCVKDATPIQADADQDIAYVRCDADGQLLFPTLTVQGTIAATQSGTWSMRLQDGSGNAITSASRGAERAATVQIVDASGNQITAFGGTTSSDAATGGAPPSDASYTGINVSSALRGWTGVNPAGSIYAAQIDIASIAGLTVSSTGGKLNIADVSTVTTITNAVTVAQATATNLKAEVIGTGTFVSQSSPLAVTTGGATMISFLTDSSTTEFVVKASAGQLYGLVVTNKLAAPMYVRVFNLSDPDCTSTTGLLGRFIVPAAADSSGGGFVESIDIGAAMGTGISLCATTTVADNNTTAIGTGNAAITALFK